MASFWTVSSPAAGDGGRSVSAASNGVEPGSPNERFGHLHVRPQLGDPGMGSWKGFMRESSNVEVGNVTDYTT